MKILYLMLNIPDIYTFIIADQLGNITTSDRKNCEILANVISILG